MPRQLLLWKRDGTSKRAKAERERARSRAQRELVFARLSGRAGARPRTKSGRVPHSTRPELSGAAHVVVRIRRGLPSLRTPRAWRVIERALRRSKQKDGFAILEFSVLDDHVHLITEAEEKLRLARGVQGLLIRLAKALNRHWHRRKGSVFADRYFSLALTGWRQIWRTFRYVLQNAKKHGIWLGKGQPDPYSSGRWFEHWSSAAEIRRPLRSPPTVNGRSFEYLVCRRIALDDLPGPRSCDDFEPLELAAT